MAILENQTLDKKIADQKSKILAGNPKIKLTSSCRIGRGITQLSTSEKTELSHLFDRTKKELDISFFIPASGSGSRMFSALFEFLNFGDPDEKTIEFVEQLLNNITSFAFYPLLPDTIKDEINEGDVDINNLINFLLFEEGLNYGNSPKGLISFHRYDKTILTPFQEHIEQSIEIGGEQSKFHFTINAAFEDKIRKNIADLNREDLSVQFSEQDPETHSVAFNDALEPAIDENGEMIFRPAGHGALIKNLNLVQSDIVFIRNIDNMQHQAKANVSIATRKELAGLVIRFKDQVHEILRLIDSQESFQEELQSLNSKYDLRLSNNQLTDAKSAHKLLSQPIRVCGMVKNEGAPGGGPFWVMNNDGIEKRQIIEKSQISGEPEQLDILVKATHFNPVELVCWTKDYKGEKFDLTNYGDESQYFIVHKTHEGQSIQYIEQPGLWNGAMANWLTLFVEIDSQCFSPVKTVLDLLQPLHQA